LRKSVNPTRPRVRRVRGKKKNKKRKKVDKSTASQKHKKNYLDTTFHRHQGHGTRWRKQTRTWPTVNYHAGKKTEKSTIEGQIKANYHEPKENLEIWTEGSSDWTRKKRPKALRGGVRMMTPKQAFTASAGGTD